jgi:glycerate 2-kinase
LTVRRGCGTRDPRVLVAPDSFKGTFPAVAIASAMVAGLASVGVASDACPLADGGEGTADALLSAFGGEIVKARVTDSLGRPIEAAFAVLGDGATAVVEVAAASGLASLSPGELDAAQASTRGTGELVLAAVDAGASLVMVAAGGSATTDGGIGAIEAILDHGGLRGTRLEVLCDTEEPFERAPRVFSPQKGADPEVVAFLEHRLSELAVTLPKDPRGLWRSGAAGGLAGGLWAVFDASLSSGADRVLLAAGVPERVAASCSVLSGEGRLDAQSLRGKLVGSLAALCARIKRPFAVIAGRLELDERERLAAGISGAREARTLPEIERAGASWGSQRLERGRSL